MNANDKPESEVLTRADGAKLGGDATESRFSPAEWDFVSQHLFAENRTYKWMRTGFEKQFGKIIATSTWCKIREREMARRNSMEAKLAKRRDAAASAKQLREETAASGVEFGEMALQRIEEIAFDVAMAEAPDIKALNELARTIIAGKSLDFDRQKFAASLKTKIETGLDALFNEIKGNKEAEELFEKFRASVRQSTQA